MNLKTNEQSQNAKRNAIADCFKILSIFVLLVGFLLIIFNLFISTINFSSIISTILYIIYITIAFFVLRAIAEMLQLLEDIKNK